MGHSCSQLSNGRQFLLLNHPGLGNFQLVKDFLQLIIAVCHLLRESLVPLFFVLGRDILLDSQEGGDLSWGVFHRDNKYSTGVTGAVFFLQRRQPVQRWPC